MFRVAAGARRGSRPARVGRAVFTAALTVAVLVAVAGFVLNFALPQWWLRHSQQVVTITSGSMEPTIHVGDQILIAAMTPQTPLRPGTVVTFENGAAGHLTTHRVAMVTTIKGQPGRWVQTKGDANRVPDPDLTPEAKVVGVMTRDLGRLGEAMTWAQTPKGRLGLFGPALVLFALAELPVVFGRSQRRPDGPDAAAVEQQG